MTDRIEYTFDLDGFVDEIRYYRSLTTIDTNNPPPPTAVLDGSDRTFVDDTVTANQIYHVIFSSYRNSVEKFSDEIVVMTSKAFRYYRIFITDNEWTTDGYSEMQEIELALTASGADITTPTTPAFQSSYFASRTASKLVDNNFTGGEAIWTSGAQTFPQWVAFDLSTVQEVKELRIYPPYAVAYSKRAPKNFVVQGSNDNANWIDIQSFSNVTGWTSGVSKKFNLVDGTYS